MKSKLIIKQEEVADCGVCSLLSVIRYYGGNVPLEELRITSNTNVNGVNAYNLIECAKKYGLNAKAYKNINVESVKTPFIAHIKINESLSHFIVVYEIKKGILIVMDPAEGTKKISVSDFNKIFTGYYIVFKPTNNLVCIKNTDKLKKKIINICCKYKKIIISILILNIIYLFLSIIDSFYISILNNNKSIIIIILFLFINILTIIISHIINKLTLKISFNTSNCFINYFYSHIFKLPLKYIHIKEKGEILNRCSDAEDYIENYILNWISIILNIFIYLVTIIILFILNKYISIYILLISIISFIILYFLYKKNDQNIILLINSSESYKNHLVEYISYIETLIHNYVANNYKNKLTDEYINLNQTRNKYAVLTNLITTLKKLYIPISSFIIITYCILVKNDYELLIITYFISNILYESFINLTSTIPSTLYIKNLYNKMNDYLYLKEDNQYVNNYNYLSIKNLSYSYDGIDNVISNFNLELSQGDKIVIKGLSGSGKSTLCKLINGDLKKYQGIIKSPKCYYVSQNENIFTDTIRNNITLGKNYNDQEIINLMKLVKADYLIDNSFGLDMFIFGGGNNLSGGEKQKLLLVRALLNKPKLLILDEALSQITIDQENSILDAIIRNYPKMILIYVSHNNIEYQIKTINM